MRIKLLALAAAFAASAPAVAHADKLDDVISSGSLRCGVVLDYPPMGSRDANNNPIGFDVDYCNDLGKALGVSVEIVETPFPDRIPALVSGRTDVGIAGTSDTLERAKTIGFSIPYFAFKDVILTREGSGIQTYEQLKGRKVGAVVGGYESLALEKDVKAWGQGSYRSYQTQADCNLALAQGQIEATIVVSAAAAAAVKDDKYKGLVVAGDAPYNIDYTGIITLRNEQGFLNYLNLFIYQQVRTGRYQELYNKWVAPGDAPDMTVPKVYR